MRQKAVDDNFQDKRACRETPVLLCTTPQRTDSEAHDNT
jgi:hypothetical protein